MSIFRYRFTNGRFYNCHVKSFEVSYYKRLYDLRKNALFYLFACFISQASASPLLASMQNFINCRSPNKPHAAGNSCCRKIDTICTLCIKHRNSIFLLLVATACVRCARTQPSTTISISKICDLLYFPIFIFIISPVISLYFVQYVLATVNMVACYSDF